MALQPRTATVLIYQGGVLDEIERLEVAIEAVEKAEQNAPPATMDEPPPASIELREKHLALIEQAQASAEKVVVQALGRRVYRVLVDKHEKPGDPTEDDPTPDGKVDEEAFFEDAVPASLVEPAFGSDAERDRFLDGLALGDWRRLRDAVYVLNEAATADPKPLPASAPTRLSDAT